MTVQTVLSASGGSASSLTPGFNSDEPSQFSPGFSDDEGLGDDDDFFGTRSCE